MSCNCKRVFKEIDDEVFKNKSKQLDICQECAYQKDVSKRKEKTYEKVRIAYVHAFWDNVRKG
jgi:hypothetical protein